LKRNYIWGYSNKKKIEYRCVDLLGEKTLSEFGPEIWLLEQFY
jgi:hypothetical protein